MRPISVIGEAHVCAKENPITAPKTNKQTNKKPITTT
jgi:hypothetical protein